jgi:hypothetical protein
MRVRREGAARGRVVPTRLLWCVVTLTMIVLAPVIVLVGEPLRRYYQRRYLRSAGRQRCGGGWRQGGLARVVIANPVLIALTAPGRWAIDHASGPGPGDSGRRGYGWRGGDGDNWPPAGTREPRRPKPNAPAGAIALAEPRQQRRTIPIRKALPQALSELSEPLRRAGSRLRRIGRVLRARARHKLA